MREELVLIAKIAGAHGVRGNTRMVSFAESLAIFPPGQQLVLQRADGRREARTVRWARPHGRGALLSLEGVDSREQAEALSGSEVYIAKDRLPAPAEGEYYWCDLIGLEVVTTAGEPLGRLAAILRTGSNDVYVVAREGVETLVPALATVVRDIDLARGRMQVELPEGL